MHDFVKALIDTARATARILTILFVTYTGSIAAGADLSVDLISDERAVVTLSVENMT